jgi:hypothetical protein
MNRRKFLSTVALSAPILIASGKTARAARRASRRVPIDTFNVFATGAVATSTALLRVGKKYSIVVGGIRQYTYGFNALGVKTPVEADAMYGLKADRSLDYRALVMQFDSDVTSGTIARAANVENFALHRYVFHIVLPGVAETTRALAVRILDSAYGDNDFGHSIEIYKGHLKKVPPVPGQSDDDEGGED